MNRIILALVVLAFVQLVKGQLPSQACIDATTALVVVDRCRAAFNTGTDFSTICMGSCRTLFNNIINNCDATIASTYSNLIDNLCGPCGMALQALAANTACTTAFSSGTADATTICMGTCRNLFDDIIGNCDASISNPYSTAISTVCDGGTNTGACAVAIGSISDDCSDSLVDGDTSVCSGSGTCATQLNAAVSACGSSTNQDYQQFLGLYNIVCTGTAACTAAYVAVTTGTCDTDDAAVLCTGTCSGFADTFVNACPADNAAVILLRGEYNRICGINTGACAVAIGNVSDDCSDSLDDGDTSVCSGSGTCATQLNAAVSACGSSTNQDFQDSIGLYNLVCTSTAACTAAYAAIATGICGSDDAAVACTGTCSGLADTFFNACPADNAAVILIRGQYNQVCGSGSIVKASGVITLLIVAISAIIFRA